MEEKDTKFVRVSVSLRRALLKEVDAFAVNCHVSRSAVITYALMVFLSELDDNLKEYVRGLLFGGE